MACKSSNCPRLESCLWKARQFLSNEILAFHSDGIGDGQGWCRRSVTT